MGIVDFEPTEELRKFMENPSATFMPEGRAVGRTAATVAVIQGTAATPEDAEKAVADLHENGFALMDDEGRHIPAPERKSHARIEWSEEKEQEQ